MSAAPSADTTEFPVNHPSRIRSRHRRAHLPASPPLMAGLSGLRLHGAGPGQSPSIGRADAAGPLGDMSLGNDNAPVTIIEYASMTCPHCAAFPRDHLSGTEEALHRHRQGALHLPRIPARSAGRRRLHAGALRRTSSRSKFSVFRDDRDAVPAAAQLGGGEADPPLLWRSPSRPASPSRPSTPA